MTKQVEVITSVQRRRRWPRAEKERIVAAAMEPGAVASDVARAAGIHVSRLFRWRQQLCNRGAAPAFAAVTVAPPGLPPGVIKVEFASGARLRIGGPIDAATVSSAITALARSERRRWIGLPAGARVWLATGHTDMRKGFDGLALLCSRRCGAIRIKAICSCSTAGVARCSRCCGTMARGCACSPSGWERGRFIWPSAADGTVTITPAQRGYLLEGIDWRMPQQTWRPTAAG
jgi:transposase-like protein/transposase